MRRASGPGSLAATILAHAVADYRSAPKDSAAYRTAKKLLEGGECDHIVCKTCLGDSKLWRDGECPPLYYEKCECDHATDQHVVVTFNWTEYRDVLIGAAGLKVDDVLRSLK